MSDSTTLLFAGISPYLPPQVFRFTYFCLNFKQFRLTSGQQRGQTTHVVSGIHSTETVIQRDDLTPYIGPNYTASTLNLHMSEFSL